MQVDIVRTDAEFVELRNDWNKLARNAAASSVFLSHEWFVAAWAWRRHDSELRLFVARSDGAIVAILPLIADRMRALALLTVPDTQHCDMVVNPASTNSAAAAFADTLALRGDWDILRLDYLDPDGAIATRLRPQLDKRSIRCVLEERGRNLFVPLSGTWAAYWASRSRSLKKASNLAANRLEKVGSVRIDRLDATGASEAERERVIDAAIGISSRSWKQRTGNSLDHRGPGDFIRALSSAALREGWLSLWLAYLDDRPVAMEYQLVYAGNVHALRSDFDADLAHDSPGSYLFRHLIEAHFGQGLSRYFMGPGQNAYKKRWTNEGIPLVGVIAYNRTLTGRLSHWMDARAKPLLRFVRDRLIGQKRDNAIDTPQEKSPR